GASDAGRDVSETSECAHPEITARKLGQIVGGGGGQAVAAAEGLEHVPARVRRAAPAPPLRLQGLEVDGVAQSGPDPVPVGSPPNQIELLASAIELQSPSEVRYRVLVDAGPARTLRDGRVQLLDLPPGLHTVEVSASLDGRRWSDPLVRRFRVATPMWRRPWVVGLTILGILGLVGGVVRARVEVLLARERERVRLAMDLHDELGSGVGSLRLLLGPLARRDLDPTLRDDILGRLRAVTGELHASLQEIVGSLRPGGASVGALADRLWRRGRALLTGVGTGLTLVLDDADRAVALPLPVCRELERIGVEALHNAARHAAATHVELGVRVQPDGVKLWVRDDGTGFSDARNDEGLGLTSMRARAERLAAELNVTTGPDGTTVEVVVARSSRWR
ncbi:MAG: ATP-binding protein, partial [Myxococcota bacterium]